MSFNYRSKEWKRLSRYAQKIARWRCGIVGCERSNAELEKLGHYLVTHHRLDANLYPDTALELCFLLVCCVECHELIHGRQFMAEKPTIIQLELDLPTPSLQLIDDMGLMERRDARRKRAGCKKEGRLYDETRAIAEREDIAEHAKRDFAIGVLENYERLAPIGEEDDGKDHSITTPKTARTQGRRPT